MEHIPVKIRAEKSWCRNAIELLITDPSFPRNGEVKVITSMIGETQREGTLCEPSAILKFQEAQVLMDDLWQAGLRPTEGTGSAGAMKAVENHLKDMRTLVSKIMKVEIINVTRFNYGLSLVV